MIVNPDNYQPMIIICANKENKHDLNINNSIIPSIGSVTHLGIEINNNLKFEKHFSTIWQKGNRQLS